MLWSMHVMRGTNWRYESFDNMGVALRHHDKCAGAAVPVSCARVVAVSGGPLRVHGPPEHIVKQCRPAGASRGLESLIAQRGPGCLDILPVERLIRVIEVHAKALEPC